MLIMHACMHACVASQFKYYQGAACTSEVNVQAGGQAGRQEGRNSLRKSMAPSAVRMTSTSLGNQSRKKTMSRTLRTAGTSTEASGQEQGTWGQTVSGGRLSDGTAELYNMSFTLMPPNPRALIHVSTLT